VVRLVANDGAPLRRPDCANSGRRHPCLVPGAVRRLQGAPSFAPVGSSAVDWWVWRLL